MMMIRLASNTVVAIAVMNNPHAAGTIPIPPFAAMAKTNPVLASA